MNDLVSVIIPVYNLESYIVSCVESITKQSYQNLEIIIVNDGSIDKSGLICDELAKKDPRIKVLHQINQGVTFARKNGVEAAMGDWIIFVDGDDTLNLDAIDFFLNIVKNNACDIVVGPEVKYQNGKYLRQSHYKVSGKLSRKQYQKALSSGAFGGGIGGKFYSRRLFTNDIFDLSNKIKNNEDYIMNMRLSKQMDTAYCEPYEGVYNANIRLDSASHIRYPKENWFELYKEIAKLSLEINNYPYLFMVNSLFHRLLTGELDLSDAKRVIKNLPANLDLPIDSRLIVKYIKSNNIIYKYLCMIYRKIYNSLLEYKIYKSHR